METHLFISKHIRGFIYLLGITFIAALAVDMLPGAQTTIIIGNAINILFIVVCISLYFLEQIPSTLMAGFLFYSIIINIIISQFFIDHASQTWGFTFIRDNIIIVMFAPAMALFMDRKHLFVVGLLILVFFGCSLVGSRNALVLINLPMLLIMNASFIFIINYLVSQMEKNQLLQEEHNRQLNKLVATKNRFFAIIAHDLKNPIGSLVGLSQLLATNFPHYSDQKKLMFIGQIEGTSKHTYDLLLNLLEWARSQSGNMDYSPREIVPVESIDEVLASLGGMIVSKGISIERSVTTGKALYADANMLSTIIRNLAVNAIKYSPRGGTIHFVVREEDGARIAIDIVDRGVGMSMEVRDGLFKVECNTYSMLGTEQEMGTGLGLIVCKEFMDRNKGELRVESEVGVGSCFSIILPRCS